MTSVWRIVHSGRDGDAALRCDPDGSGPLAHAGAVDRLHHRPALDGSGHLPVGPAGSAVQQDDREALDQEVMPWHYEQQGLRPSAPALRVLCPDPELVALRAREALLVEPRVATLVRQGRPCRHHPAPLSYWRRCTCCAVFGQQRTLESFQAKRRAQRE